MSARDVVALLIGMSGAEIILCEGADKRMKYAIDIGNIYSYIPKRMVDLMLRENILVERALYDYDPHVLKRYELADGDWHVTRGNVSCPFCGHICDVMDSLGITSSKAKKESVPALYERRFRRLKRALRPRPRIKLARRPRGALTENSSSRRYHNKNRKCSIGRSEVTLSSLRAVSQ